MGANARGEASIRADIALAICAALAVLLRLLGRWRSKASYGADDCLAVASLIPFYAMCILGGFFCAVGGLGKPFATLTLTETKLFFRISTPTWITYSTALTLVRLSILLFYRRIFSTGRFRLVTIIVGVTCLTWYVAEVLVSIFQCRPIAGAWDKSIPSQCLDFASLYYGIAGSSLALDVIVLVLPMKMIWGLKLATKHRVGLCGIFLLGTFACVASLGRIVTAGNIKNEDLSYTLLIPYTFSTLEPFLAILCSCLPTYGPLLPTRNYAKVLNERFGSHDTGQGSSEGEDPRRKKEGYEIGNEGNVAHTRPVSGRTRSDTWRTETTVVEDANGLERHGTSHRWGGEQQRMGRVL